MSYACEFCRDEMHVTVEPVHDGKGQEDLREYVDCPMCNYGGN